MKYTARQLAALLNGEVVGNPDVTVDNVSRIEEGKAGTLSFLANPKYTRFVYTTGASIVLVNEAFKPESGVPCTLIRVKDAYSAFARLLELYNQEKLNKSGISDKAYRAASAKIGSHVYIGEFAFIGEGVVIADGARIFPQVFIGDHVKIGRNTVLFAGSRVYYECVIGDNCRIHAGAVIGADGFGFAPLAKEYQKIPQIGNVMIEDDVEIGANTTIDRATIGSTILRKGVKLDNLIQVAHNVEIGENTVIAAQTGISGSTKIGRNCMIGGQVGIIGHLTIADEVKIAAQSGIGASITEKGAVVQGSPAFEMSKYKRCYVHFRNLPDSMNKLSELEKGISKKD